MSITTLVLLATAWLSPILSSDGDTFHVATRGNRPDDVCIHYRQTTNLKVDEKGQPIPYAPYGCLHIPDAYRGQPVLDLDWDNIQPADADWEVWVNLYVGQRVLVSNLLHVHR